MHKNICILLPLLTFSSIRSFDQLPHDLYSSIFVNLDFKSACTYLSVSRWFYAKISSEILPAIKKIPKYTEINEQLLYRTETPNEYDALLKANPYADINYTNRFEGTCGAYFVATKLFYHIDAFITDHSIFDGGSTQTNWVTFLLSKSASLHIQIDALGHRPLTALSRIVNRNIWQGYTEWEHKNALAMLDIILKYSAENKKELVTLADLRIQDALKQKPFESYYKDRRPFMQSCVDYFKLIAHYGFDIKEAVPHPLHFHLHNNPHPAPVMVKYLVEELQRDPHESVTVNYVATTPCQLASNLTDEPLKKEILSIFENYKKPVSRNL